MIGNMVAGSFLKPTGWKVEGGLKWYPDFIHQVCMEVKVSDPASAEQFEALPWSYAFWLTGARLQPFTLYQGKLVHEPLLPADMIEKVTLPICRKGLKVKIVKHHDMPEVAALCAKASGAKVRAVRSRVEYEHGGKTVEEDFYLVLAYSSTNLGDGSVATFWWPLLPPFALRAARGELDAATPRLLAVAYSGQANPKWLEGVTKVQGLFLERIGLAIKAAGDISTQTSANNDALIGLLRGAREAREAAQGRAAQNFSDYIRGVEGYTGGGASYTLPSGYRQAWAGSNGQVILSNDPNYDPNVGGTTTWTNLRPGGR